MTGLEANQQAQEDLEEISKHQRQDYGVEQNEVNMMNDLRESQDHTEEGNEYENNEQREDQDMYEQH